jgi:integrase
MAYSRIKRKQVKRTVTLRDGSKVKRKQTRYYASIMWKGHELGLGSFLTKEGAEQAILRAQNNIANGLHPKTRDSESVTMNQLWLMMLETGVKTGKWRPRTVERNTGNYTRHVAPEFGDRNLRDITRADIQQWVNKLCDKKARSKETNLSPSTVDGVYRQMRHMFNEALAYGFIEKSPIIRIKKPSPSTSEIDCLTTEEVEDLLAVMDMRLSTYFSILAYAGLRAGEGLGLKGKNIDFVNKRIRVTNSWSRGCYTEPKTEAGKRSIPMLPILEKRLEGYLKRENIGEEDFLFRSPKSKDNNPYPGLGRQLKKALYVAGIRPVTPHSFRHSFATLMIGSGASIVAVSKVMGHKSIKITLDRYSHLFPQDLDNAIAKLIFYSCFLRIL